MTSEDYQIIQPSDEFKQSMKYFLVITLVFIVITTILWLVYGLSISSFVFSLVTIILFILLLFRLPEVEKSISILPSSIETRTRKNHEIVDFNDIIEIKLQFEQYTPGFFAFHPTSLIISIFRNLNNKEALSTRMAFQIETETHYIYDIILSPERDKVNNFIETLVTNSGIKPVVKDYRTEFGRGSIIFFSFKTRHSDLDPDEVSGLI